MKGLVGGIPLALLVAAVANGQEIRRAHGNVPTTAIGGPSGDDGGNSAGIGFESSYSSSVKESYTDDHSFHLKNHVMAPPPPMPDFRKRGDRDVLGGPSGDDGGNSADISFESVYSSTVEDWYKDDHSIDIENHVPPPSPSSCHPGFRKRYDNPTVIGGPSGNDGGNSINIEFDSTYTASVEDWYKNDHSVEIETNIVHPPIPGFRKRGDGGNSVGPSNHNRNGRPSSLLVNGHTVLGGPSSEDDDSSADVGYDSTYTSSVEDTYEDDHSIDIENHVVAPPPRGPMMPFHKRTGPTIIGGPSGNDIGNSVNIVFDSDYSSEVNDHYEDDHSSAAENWIIHPPVVYPSPQPLTPGFYQPGYSSTPADLPSKPCSTKIVLQTVTRILSEDVQPTAPSFPYHPSLPAPSFAVYQSAIPKPDPSTPSGSLPEPSSVTPTQEPELPKSEPSGPDHGHYQSSKPATSTTPCHSGPTAPSYAVHEPSAVKPEASAPVSKPSFTPRASTTPFPTPVYNSIVPAEPLSTHLPTIASTIAVNRPSSFAVVPVYIPSAHSHAISSSTPTSSQLHPSAADPWRSSESAIYHHSPSAAPDPGMLFTGAAGMAPTAGIVSVVAGLLAALAFVL